MVYNNFPGFRIHSSWPMGALLLAVLLLSGCQRESSQSDTPLQNIFPQTIPEFFPAAIQAMGADGVTRVEYGGDGWEACLGQPWKLSEGWARWSVTDYNRVIDYGSFNSLQSAQRRAGMDPEMLGGCGAQPSAAAQNQQSAVNAESPWLQQLQVHMTPLGFLLLARNNGARIESAGGDLKLVLEDIEVDGVGYTMEGSYGDDLLLDHVITRVDDSVYGDMTFETEFIAYTSHDGLMFPARIVQKQGGFSTLDLNVNAVIPNSEASAIPEPREGGRFGGGQQPDLPAYEVIGEGVYALHGAYQSVVMEFESFSVVLDGLQNDSRVLEIINLAKQIIPEKPIGYVLTTHAHFDHANGLRQFVAEGTSIITHQGNAEFFHRTLSIPRTLNAEAGHANGMPVTVLGVSDFFVIDDGSQRVEIYKLEGSLHADDMLVAYIPSIKTIVEADLLQPWINPVFGGGEHPFLVHLADELERLGLDYEQFVPVHRPSSPPLMTREDLMQAVGRN